MSLGIKRPAETISNTCTTPRSQRSRVLDALLQHAEELEQQERKSMSDSAIDSPNVISNSKEFKQNRPAVATIGEASHKAIIRRKFNAKHPES